MLKSALSPHKSPKIHQYILRRRARNLRAKVKALLPAQVCCKHDHRNRCVKDIENNKKAWECIHNSNKWTMTVQKQNPYYYENQPYIDHIERFQKLTHLQIQQIKEDRLYYLGQQNLEDFQLFLQEKYKLKDNKDTIEKDVNIATQLSSQKHQHNLNRTFSSIMLRRMPQAILQFMDKRRNSEQSENVDDGESQCFYNDKKQKNSRILMNKSFDKKSKKSVDQKLKEFDERRKIIEYQQKSKILVDKVKLNMRLQRAEGIAKQKRAKKLSQLQERRAERQEHLQRISSRRRNQQNQGQIKLLQEKLRKTFLDRKCLTTTTKNWRNLRTNIF